VERSGTSRSKRERIKIIMGRSPSPVERRTKKVLVEPREWGKQKYSETILLLSRARAGFTRYIFFLLV
jgi:hypothetical protein